MREKFIESEAIENYLFQRLNKEERNQFELNMMLNPTLAENVEAQAETYKLVRRFSRMETRKRLEHIYQQLLQETSFAQQLQNIFA